MSRNALNNPAWRETLGPDCERVHDELSTCWANGAAGVCDYREGQEAQPAGPSGGTTRRWSWLTRAVVRYMAGATSGVVRVALRAQGGAGPSRARRSGGSWAAVGPRR